MRLPVTPVRKELGKVGIEKICQGYDGITLVETDREDSGKRIQCAQYCFGEDKVPRIQFFRDVALTTNGYTEVETPQVGDLVIYISIDDGFSKEQAHIGRLIRPDIARSKWGDGYVYEHKIELVPDIYGEEVRFFRANALTS